MKLHEKRYLSALLAEAQNGAGEIDALAIAVALPACRNWLRTGRTDILIWLQHNAPFETQAVLRIAARCANESKWGEEVDSADPFLCEKLLSITATKQRRQQGTFYTPQPLADYLVKRIDEALTEHFGLSHGLADTTSWAELQTRGTVAMIPSFIAPQQPFVQLLDPALGSGMFPLAVLRRVHAKLVAAKNIDRWNDAVHSLLPRLQGWELSLAGLVSAVIQLATLLAETNFTFQGELTIPWQLRDALARPSTPCSATIVLGNPPYSSLSTAKHGWLEALISDPTNGYTSLHGEPLGEKKHWLHDDYVKFMRLAQWQVQQMNCGIVGLVTNHGYLENVSFRGMRAALCETFSQIELLDLHGNAKNRQHVTSGEKDENVFGIAAGIALNLLVRPPRSMPGTRVMHREFRGSRASKLERLTTNQLGPANEFQPASPLYLFAPQRKMASSTYQLRPSLCEIMPFRASAPVTARDHFTVAFTRAELMQRLTDFRDLRISDDTIRERYFQRTRSPKYASGDTRGWKLSTARQRFASVAEWANCIREVQYRPLDVRYIAWHDTLIDWPRPEFARYMLAGENVALIARRQSPAHQPANFFWATKQLTLDGILRSDNRGNESLFPLWLYDAAGNPSPNFSTAWIDAIERLSQRQATPRELLAYIYGCFFSSEYRQANHVGLVHDYPRVPYPRDADEFILRSQHGEKLLQLHTEFTNPTPSSNSLSFEIAKGYPNWQAGHIAINAECQIAEVDEETWNFTLGTHQVARKWLKDRVGRTLHETDLHAYGHLLAILQRTRVWLEEIAQQQH